MADTVEYLGCAIGKAHVAVPVPCIREVFQSKAVTRVPGCPAFVAGMVNVRGQIVPVLDLLKSGMKTADAKMIVLNTEQGMVGLLVRDITDLIRFDTTGHARSLPPELAGMEEYFSETGTTDAVYHILKVEELIQSTIHTG